eukprot:gene6827-30800_t
MRQDDRSARSLPRRRQKRDPEHGHQPEASIPVVLSEDDNSDDAGNTCFSPSSILLKASSAPPGIKTELDANKLRSLGREYKSLMASNMWHVLNVQDTLEDLAALMASVVCGSTFELGGITLRSTTKPGAVKNGSLAINLDGAVLKNGTIELERGEQLIITGQGVHLHKITVVGQGLTLQSMTTRARLSKDKDKDKDKDKENADGLVKLTRASGIVLKDCALVVKSSAATYALCVEQDSSATLDNCTITGSSRGTGILAVGAGVSIIAHGCSVQGCKKAGVAALRGGSIMCEYSSLTQNEGCGVQLTRCDVLDNKGYGVAFFEGATGVLDDCKVADNAFGGLLMSNRPTGSSWIDRMGSSLLFGTFEPSGVKGKDNDVGHVSERRTASSRLARKYLNNNNLLTQKSNTNSGTNSNTNITTSTNLSGASSGSFPVSYIGRDAGKSPFSVAGNYTDVGQTPFSTGTKEAPQGRVLTTQTSSITTEYCEVKGEERDAGQVQGQTSCQLLTCKVMGNRGNGLTLEGSGTKTKATGCQFSENRECGVAVLESAHVEFASCQLANNGLSGPIVQAASAKAGPVAATVAMVTDVDMVKNKKHGARVAGTDTSVTFESSMFDYNCKSGLSVIEGGQVHASGSEFNCNAVSGMSLKGGDTIALKCLCNGNEVEAVMATTGATGHFTECTLNAYNNGCVTIVEKAMLELVNCIIDQEPVLLGGSEPVAWTRGPYQYEAPPRVQSARPRILQSVERHVSHLLYKPVV